MFEQDFLVKLAEHDAPLGMKIYANNISSGRISALEGTFPATASCLGEEFFKQACAFYAKDNAGESSNLNLYGRTFGRFLASLSQCQHIPYLRDLADFEYHSRRLFYALDENYVTAQEIANASDDLHISLAKASLLFSTYYPIPDIADFCLELGELPPITSELRHYFLYRSVQDNEIYVKLLDDDSAQIIPILRDQGLSGLKQENFMNHNISETISFLMLRGLFVTKDILCYNLD